MPSLNERARELRQDRQKVILAAREFAERTDEEGRAAYDKAMADVLDLKEKIEKVERQAELEAELADLKPEDRGSGTPGENPEEKAKEQAFERFIRVGRSALSGAETRALQMDIDESGGYLVPPQQFVNQLIKAVDDQVFVRRYANVIPMTGAHSLGAPSLDADPADPTWTSELLIGSEDSTMDVGKREMVPHPLAQFIKVSNKLIRNASSVTSLVAQRLGYKKAVVEESAFLTGSGASQPLGVFTASASGVATAQDVSTDNTTTALTADGLINAKYHLRSGYLVGARWLFHRDAVKMLAKLKDGEGQYLWHGSIVSGSPDMLLGLPVDTSEYAPNTFTTGLYVGILANWSYYWIADSMQFTLQRLDELYAATNQTGFISRTEADGAPVLSAAFARVKLA